MATPGEHAGHADLSGQQLGPYRLESLLGAGGMGEVYRAVDTRLQRTVAVKVVAAAVADDAQLRARFQREAKAIAALNHPHIVTLYDVGVEGATAFLVTELLDGESLAARLGRGPLPYELALTTAIQIADALAAAHKHGIIHRDLKPGNVMLTKSGAKLLDFGLAKHAAVDVVGDAAARTTAVPDTARAPLTSQGTILGTVTYMAPEQLEGKDADSRTDVFAFGALVYEMLTGRRAFEGGTTASLIAAIMHGAPASIATLQPVTPPALERLIATCLAKDPDDRWQSMRDVARELRGIQSPSGEKRPPRPTARWSLAARVAGLALAGLVGAIGAMLVRPLVAGRSPAAPVVDVEFTVAPPDGARFGGPLERGSGPAPQFALAPDGRALAFVAFDTTFALWVRGFDSVVPRRLAGTEGGTFPFWSPDSQFIGFFAEGKLKKVPANGGIAVALCAAPMGRGGTWNREGTIVFSPFPTGPLQRVDASGGTPRDLTLLDADYGETGHRFPQFLPDGVHVVYTAVTGSAGLAPKTSRVRVASLNGPAVTDLVSLESSAQFTAGHLLYLRLDDTLVARPLDLASMTFTGDERPVAQAVGSEGSRYAAFSAAPDGTLAVADGYVWREFELAIFDRTGTRLQTVGQRDLYASIDLARDDRSLAVERYPRRGRGIFVVDLLRDTMTSVTAGGVSSPVWAPDGRRLATSRDAAGGSTLSVLSLDRPTQPVDLARFESTTTTTVPTDWSRNGEELAYHIGIDGRGGIWSMSVATGASRQIVDTTQGMNGGGRFSPDGTVLAYHATRFGQAAAQVFVKPLGGGAEVQVSQQGGSQPLWREDGRELYFLGPNGAMMATPMSSPVGPGRPVRLFDVAAIADTRRSYAAVSDGQRFVVVNAVLPAGTKPLTVRTHWVASLAR